MSYDYTPQAGTGRAGLDETCRAVRGEPCPYEPSLDELLADPLIRLVMKQDGVTESAIRRLADRIGAGHPQLDKGVAL